MLLLKPLRRLNPWRERKGVQKGGGELYGNIPESFNCEHGLSLSLLRCGLYVVVSMYVSDMGSVNPQRGQSTGSDAEQDP